MLGACGGHQLIAMAAVHPEFQSFLTEFSGYPDSLSQVVITCSTVPAYGCGSLSPEDCCYEGGAVEPFKDLVPNVPGLAMKNPYETARWDMLFNLLPPAGRTAIRSYLYHEDFVDPVKIAPYFDLIATYPAAVTGPSRANPSEVQAMKFRDGPVYGTQFHWDENHVGECGRDPGNLNMERVLKNFVGISLSYLHDPAQYRLTSVSRSEGLERLADLDRSTQWCGEDFTLDLRQTRALDGIVWVEGETAARASHQSYRLETSLDGRHWAELPVKRASAYEVQRNRNDGCDAQTEPLAGAEDGQTFVLTPAAGAATARYLRVRLTSDDGKPACLRELMPY